MALACSVFAMCAVELVKQQVSDTSILKYLESSWYNLIEFHRTQNPTHLDDISDGASHLYYQVEAGYLEKLLFQLKSIDPVDPYAYNTMTMSLYKLTEEYINTIYLKN